MVIEGLQPIWIIRKRFHLKDPVNDFVPACVLFPVKELAESVLGTMTHVSAGPHWQERNVSDVAYKSPAEQLIELDANVPTVTPPT